MRLMGSVCFPSSKNTWFLLHICWMTSTSNILNGPQSEAYAYVGRLVFDASAIELELDKYNFEFCRKFPDRKNRICDDLIMDKGAKKFYHFSINQKISFFIQSFTHYSPLLMVQDAEGRLDLNSFGYTMDEFFDIRNHCIHGCVDLIVSNENLLKIRATKLSKNRKFSNEKQKLIPEKGKYKFSTYEYTSLLMDRLYYEAAYIKSIIRQASQTLDNPDYVPEMIKREKEARSNRQALTEVFGLPLMEVLQALLANKPLKPSEEFIEKQVFKDN